MRRIRLTDGRGRLFALTLAAASILPFTGASAAVGASPSTGGVDEPQVEIQGTASARQLGNAFAAVVDAVRPAVVFIMVETVTTGLRMPPGMPTSLHGTLAGAFPPATTASGTGFIIDTGHLQESFTACILCVVDQSAVPCQLVGTPPDNSQETECTKHKRI